MGEMLSFSVVLRLEKIYPSIEIGQNLPVTLIPSVLTVCAHTYVLHFYFCKDIVHHHFCPHRLAFKILNPNRDLSRIHFSITLTP